MIIYYLAGSLYYSYKQFHSTVMLAMCETRYCFTYVNIGSFGRDNDCAIFSVSKFFQDFHHLSVPPNNEIGPFYIVGDEIFPPKEWLMKPYPGKGLTKEQRVFNYRLSRCRRTIENAFGVLRARWRIFMRPIRVEPTTVDLIVKAATCLHNSLILMDTARYNPAGFVDSYSGSGDEFNGDWRTITQEDSGALNDRTSPLSSNNHSLDAKTVRDRLKAYVSSPEGSLAWQSAHVRNCGRVLTD